MATSILTEATSFLTDSERAYHVGNGPAALIMNPTATMDALFAAVESRACRLRESLGHWARIIDDGPEFRNPRPSRKH